MLAFGALDAYLVHTCLPKVGWVSRIAGSSCLVLLVRRGTGEFPHRDMVQSELLCSESQEVMGGAQSIDSCVRACVSRWLRFLLPDVGTYSYDRR